MKNNLMSIFPISFPWPLSLLILQLGTYLFILNLGFKVYIIAALSTISAPGLNSVMWFRIDRMQIRIQDNKNTKLISNHLLKVKKKNIFKICT